jgi:phospholipid-binding lipoprotein MlaA
LKAVRRAGLTAALALVAIGCATPERPDPWEPMNRGIFAFNETVDQYALEPVARVWDFVLPDFAQKGLRNFYDNLRMPNVFVNDLLQGKPVDAGWDVLRLFYNTVFGAAGFVDIATMVEIPRNDEDFGQTLGTWGVPQGPYLVVPLLGPYTIRSGAGTIVDTMASAYGYYNWFWMGVVGLNGLETFGASAGVRGLELLNLRAIFLEEIDASRRDAFDYYVFVRNAYLQNRRAKVLDQTDTPVVDQEELYYFDDDDEEEDYDDD